MREHGHKDEDPVEYTEGSHPFGRTESERPVFTTRLGRFLYSFKNVFWFHYKWHVIAGVTALLLLAVFARDMLNKKTPEFQFVVATKTFISEESLEEMTDIANAMFVLDGDERRECAGYSQYMADSGELAMTAYTKMVTFFVDDDIRFFIFDEGTLETFFNDPEGFAVLSARGYATVSGKPWIVELTGLPLPERSGLSGIQCYAAIQLAKDGDKNAELSDSMCFAFLDALLNTP